MWLHRQLKNQKKVTTQEIADRWGGSVRTAQRAVEYMRDQLLAPVAYDTRRRTFYYTDMSYELPSISLSDGETIALLLVYEGILEKLPLPLARDLSTAVSKLQEFLPNTTSVNLPDMMARLSFDMEPHGKVAPIYLDQLRQALEARRTVRMTYYTASRDELLERELAPYHLVYRRGDWYAVGRCHLRNQVQTFAISRIRALTLTDHKYQIPADFKAEQYFEYAFGVDIAGQPTDVTLEFELPEARYVGERVWHPSQQLERLEDGRLRVRMHVKVTYELRQWILSYGSRVRVITPQSLQDEIAAELGRAAERYRA